MRLFSIVSVYSEYTKSKVQEIEDLAQQLREEVQEQEEPVSDPLDY